MQKNNDIVEKTIKSGNTFLSRWNGKSAVLWELTSSMKCLRVLIRDDTENTGNLLIACIDPYYIKAQVSWKHCQISVDCIQGVKIDFRLSDKDADMEIWCGKIEFKENVKLW